MTAPIIERNTRIVAIMTRISHDTPRFPDASEASPASTAAEADGNWGCLDSDVKGKVNEAVDEELDC